MLFLFPGAMHIVAQGSKQTLTAKSTGNIYLYGESHGREIMLKKEIEIWGDYYNHKGFRHLFLETSYYTAEFLNIWMHANDDEILDKVYDELEGTASHTPAVKDFYKEIKSRFPETVFHGTDVGHQYMTTGTRYLAYLSEQNKANTRQYQLAKEAIEQGKYFYGKKDDVYRENMMVANFVREFNNLNKNESIMGIYGSAHTGILSMDNTNSVPSMANQLHKLYPGQLFAETLVDIVKPANPLRIDSIKINGSYYKAPYFGRANLKGFKDFAYREFWRLEGAYNDFKNNAKTGDVLPYNNYPMKMDSGQVFVIDYMKIDSTFFRKFYRSDGKVWNNLPVTEEFKTK